MNPLVSVVVPVYNAQDTIVSTLKSVYNQTYPHWELLIVIDGATDDSKNLIYQYVSTTSTTNRVEVIEQVNQGVATARNTGMKASKGKYMALLDSDDGWLPTKLERQVEVLEANSHIALLATTMHGETSTVFYGKKFDNLQEVSVKTLLMKNFFYTSTTIFKSAVTKDVGYHDEDIRGCEDFDYFLRIAHQHNAYVLSEPLVTYSDGNKPMFGHSGVSGNLKEMGLGELDMIKKFYKNGGINFIEFLWFYSYSFLKLTRRYLLVFFRKSNQD